MNHDYAGIDAKTPYNWRVQRLEAARDLGYEYISECIVSEYRKTRSAAKVGQIQGGISPERIRRFLKQIGEPINPPGGYRHGDRRQGKVTG